MQTSLRAGVFLAVLVVFVGTQTFAITGAHAASGAPLDPDAVRTAIDLERVITRIETIERSIAVAKARLSAAQAALDETNTKIVANQARIASVSASVRARAVVLYQERAQANNALLHVQSVSSLNVAEQYTHAAIGVDDSQLEKLMTLENTLQQEHSERSDLRDQVASTERQLENTRRDLQEARDREQALLDAWGAVPVMGDAWLSADELAAWFKATYPPAALAPGTTIDDLARLYIVEGNAERVRGDVAFAQSIVETGAFQVAAGNNYAGIGACDSCKGGLIFATPLDGVRAQIQLLENYADPDSRAQSLANPPSPGLYGSDPQRAAALYDSFFAKGRAPLWNVMGNGNWATDPNYADKVIAVFAREVAYAAAHRN